MIKFNSAPSYFWLNAWVLANIIELATQQFCDRFVDYKIDPGHRLYDQMTQAARSIRGGRQGQQFWGCSDYPKCNGTRNN